MISNVVRLVVSPISRARTVCFAIAIGASAAPALAQSEDFDQAGSAWSATVFAATALDPTVSLDRDVLSGPTVPSTTPPLPINTGTDKEARMRSTATSGLAHSYAMLPAVPDNVWENQRIAGFLGVEFAPGAPGSDSAVVGLAVRGTETGTTASFTGYRCMLRARADGSAFVRLTRDDGGAAAAVLYDSDPFPFAADEENIYMEVIARGSDISVEVRRAFEFGGTVFDEGVDLDAATPGVQSATMVSDPTYPTGRVGLTGRPDDAASVLWDSCDGESLRCDALIDHEPPVIPGGSASLGYLATKDGVDIYHETFRFCGGAPSVGSVGVLPSGFCGFGDGQVGFASNGNYMFDFTGLAEPVQYVILEWLQKNGDENLAANTAPTNCMNFGDFDLTLDTGVTAHSVVTATDLCGASNTSGLLVVAVDQAIGSLERLWIGGQEFELDNICVITGYDNACFCDCNGDGTLNIDDIDCFIAAFLAGDLAGADCDGNGTLNVDDIDCFVTCFLAGCP